MISRIALIAAAGLLLGAAMTPAMAADLGGGCCADLEERVAELEATTARKGNRVVSLQIYGTVAKGLLIWDNGNDSDAYVVDNDAITSVLGFKGKAALKPGWSTGFKVELAVQDASSNGVDNDTNFDDPGDNISIRESYVYIESERLGRISLGQQLLAADGTAGVSLANTLLGANPDHGGGFAIFGTGATAIRLGDFANTYGPGRNDAIRYDSPSIYGFIISADWGDNDYWDVAARFAKEWNSIKIAAAIGYQNFEQNSGGALLGDVGGGVSYNALTGSISVMHVPTGLFVNFGAGEKELKDFDADSSFWFVQGGIERKWLPYGATTLYGQYGKFDDTITTNNTRNGLPESVGASSDATEWGFGVVQHFDSAALDLYAQVTFWDLDASNTGELAVTDEFSAIMIGAKIDF